MANLSTTYANTVGVKLPKVPQDYPTNFIPVPEKYFVIYNGGDYPSFVYDHFDKAFSLLRPYLGEIKIVQVGVASDKLLEGVIDYRSKSNFRQTCFIIENALMLISGDSVWNYVAGAKSVPFLLLGSPTPAISAVPFYKKEYDVLESHRNGDKPSYADVESPKTINLIKPELIAEKIAARLNIGYDKIVTKRLGYLHNMKIIDYIPDCLPIKFESMPSCRMDVVYNLDYLARFLSVHKANVVTDKPIDLKIISSFVKNIHDLVILLDNNFPIDYIKALHNSGVSYKLVSYKTDKELSDLRAKYFAFNQVYSKIVHTLEEVSPEDYFTTNRVYYGRGKNYKSLYHYRNNIEWDASPIGEALKDRDFKEATDSFHIYSHA